MRGWTSSTWGGGCLGLKEGPGLGRRAGLLIGGRGGGGRRAGGERLRCAIGGGPRTICGNHGQQRKQRTTFQRRDTAMCAKRSDEEMKK